MENVRLKVIYDKMSIEIPFKDILNLDEFTRRFNSPLEICGCINRIYELGYDKEEFQDSVVLYDKKNKNSKLKDLKLPVRLERDNYLEDSVRSEYKRFFKDDRTRLREWKYGVRSVKGNKALDDYVFGRSDMISDSNIERVVELYLNSYSKYRQAYFTLLEHGYNVEFEKEDDKKKIVNRTDLSLYDTGNTYYDSLKRYGLLDEEKADKVIEELSLEDLEVLRREFTNSRYSLFDGNIKKISNEDRISEIQSEDLMVLEYMTGYGIDILKDKTIYNIKGRNR